MSARMPSAQDAKERASAAAPELYSEAQRVYLDAVRVVATHLVLVEHTCNLFGIPRKQPLAHLGVALFFMLSGLLIYGTAARRPPGQGSFYRYLADRSARIFAPFVPALILVALANPLFALSSHAQPGISRGAAAFLGNLLLLQDYPLFQAAAQSMDTHAFHVRPYNAAEPFWTIPVEYWTYVCFGLAFFGVWRGERIARAWALPLAALSVPVFVWNAFAGGGHTLSLIWTLGALLAAIWSGALMHHPRRLGLGLGLSLFGLVALAGRIVKSGFHPYELQTTVLIGAIFFGLFVCLRDVRTVVAPLSRPIQLLASYSYSLYLVHNVVLVTFAERLQGRVGSATPWLAALSAHALAFAFYLAFERHHARLAAWLKGRSIPSRGRGQQRAIEVADLGSTRGG